MRNHKQEYPYNYEYLEREMREATVQLSLILEDKDLTPNMELWIKRTIKDMNNAINHTKHNLENAKNSPQTT